MIFTNNGLAQKLIDIIGVDLVRHSDYQLYSLLSALLFTVTLSLFLIFVFKLIVYISKT